MVLANRKTSVARGGRIGQAGGLRGKRKGRPPTPGTTFLQTERTSGSMTAAPIPHCGYPARHDSQRVRLRKPEAAHLMDWFYEIPPCRWLLLLEDRAPTMKESGPQPQYAPCRGWMSRRHFWGRMPPRYGVY